MEAIVPGIIGELAGRSISFLIDKYQDRTAQTEEERLERLRRLLLRVRVAVEEAEGRHITSHAMLLQLSILRKEMYKGYYTLDTMQFSEFRGHQHGEDVEEARGGQGQGHGHQVSRSFALSRFIHASKRLCLRSGSGTAKELQQVTACLENITQHVNELAVFLSGCQHLPRQPYSMYGLFMDDCMFGRQMEMEHVLSFLLAPSSSEDRHVGVLPVIGPARVGKSTLVEHACIDQRVRDRFSRTMRFSVDDLADGSGVALARERSLIIVELDGEIDQGVWDRFYSASQRCVSHGSKIVVTSRTAKIASLIGSGCAAQPLQLRFLSEEAFWYFFKVRVFGSMDPAENPRVASIAMAMAREASGRFHTANVLIQVVRSNFSPSFWSTALQGLRGFKKKNRHVFLDHIPADPWQVMGTKYMPIPNTESQHVVALGEYYLKGADEAESIARRMLNSARYPMVTVRDIVLGTATLEGRFHVLEWRSHIPPYCRCVLHCEVRSCRSRSRSRARHAIAVSRMERTQRIG